VSRPCAVSDLEPSDSDEDADDDGQLPSSNSVALSSQSVHDNGNESAASCSYSHGPCVSKTRAVSDLEPSDSDEDADERVPQPTQRK